WSELAKTTGTICAMGAVARDALWSDAEGGILASRGWHLWQVWHAQQPGREREVYVCAHPAYYLYNPKNAPMLLKDLQRLKRGKLVAPTVEPVVLDTKELLEAFIAALHSLPLEDRGFVAFDLETDQVDYMRDRILCMSISMFSGVACIIPDSLLYQNGKEWCTLGWSKDKWEAFMSDLRYVTGIYLQPSWDTVALLREMFAIPGYRWVAHNSKFDMRFLKGQLGVENVHCDFDTIVAHYTLDERKGGHALKPLADDYFDSGDYEAELFNYITKKSGRYSGIPREVLYQYNAMDTELTLRLAYQLEEELKQQGLYEQPFMFPMMAALPMLLDAELQGVSINWSEFERIDDQEIEPELQRIALEMQEISGHLDLNPMSSKKVNDILYDEMNFPLVQARTRAAGQRVTGRSSQKAIMDAWAKLWKQGKLNVSKRAWAFAEALRKYRHIRKMRGSYIRK
ncbi:unnamed protein product, partial [marine sediment metagenome]